MSDKLTRAFICIDFSDEVIKEVARIYEGMRNLSFIGKLIELENLHLTLKFLGEINQDKIDITAEKLKAIKTKKFNASLGEIGIFFVGKMRKPKIVWIKINGKEIWDLQEEIDRLLHGVFEKQKDFNSHSTIARVRYTKDKHYFEKYLKNIAVKKIKFEVDCFKIKSSELRPNGPVYRLIEKIELN